MHINNGNCKACQDKLVDVCKELSDFATILQSLHPEAHVSCGYRSAEAQQEAFNSGHSRALPGQSKHNVMPSEALDWFRLTQAGGASFDAVWYRNVLAPIAKAHGLVWGGDWNSIKDMPHVEISPK